MSQHEHELNTGHQDTNTDSARGYFIQQVSVEQRETIMILNAAKQGCNRIVFQFEERGDLKRILLGIFESGKSFDFNIAQNIGGGRCKVNRIQRVW
ncbi:MAG: hypothetical protein GY940_24350 [bacterium]|nr:hypothetical protein [bacterium]